MAAHGLLSYIRHSSDYEYSENVKPYIWGKTFTRMVIEVQCLAVAIIVTSQVWILCYYGVQMFDNLIGNDIVLPLVYLFAVIIGTTTYAQPTYWRIAAALAGYGICMYYSLSVTTFELNVLLTPTLKQLIQKNPVDAGVWIPWAIGFAFHVHICITSFLLCAVSIRDMYHFQPILLSTSSPTITPRKRRGGDNEGGQQLEEEQTNFIRNDLATDGRIGVSHV